MPETCLCPPQQQLLSICAKSRYFSTSKGENHVVKVRYTILKGNSTVQRSPAQRAAAVKAPFRLQVQSWTCGTSQMRTMGYAHRKGIQASMSKISSRLAAGYTFSNSLLLLIPVVWVAELAVAEPRVALQGHHRSHVLCWDPQAEQASVCSSYWPLNITSYKRGEELRIAVRWEDDRLLSKEQSPNATVARAGARLSRSSGVIWIAMQLEGAAYQGAGSSERLPFPAHPNATVGDLVTGRSNDTANLLVRLEIRGQHNASRHSVTSAIGGIDVKWWLYRGPVQTPEGRTIRPCGYWQFAPWKQPSVLRMPSESRSVPLAFSIPMSVYGKWEPPSSTGIHASAEVLSSSGISAKMTPSPYQCK